MARTRQLRVELVGDERRLLRSFDRIEQHTGRFARSFGRATTLVGAGLAAMAGGQVVGAIKSMVDEAREAEKVGRQTAAVIKATGGVANVSAKDVDRLSRSLMRKVAVDDEVIATGANMLLTFKGVRNEQGKNNDIFDQATVAALDMTAALNKGEVTQEGLQSSSIRLGRALNDPIKGVTALTRAGVTFTDAQKEQIRTLVEAGDVMGAQKIILKELGSEFGGAAKAAVDPWKRLGVILGEIKQRIGTALLPTLERGAKFITDDFIPAAERFWARHGPAFRDAVSEINQTVGTFFRQLKDNLEPQLDRVKDAWNDNKQAIKEVITTLGSGEDEFANGEDAARSLGDGLVKATEFAGALARMLKRVEGHLNDFQASSDKAAQGIHNKFVRPMAASMGVLVERWVTGFHAMVRVAATAAEAMHLPWARSLRKAEQDIGSFRSAFNREMNALRDERVNLDVKGTFQPPKGMSMRDIVFRAGGGPISGRGTATSDSVPAMLSRGEHVWSAAEVAGAGGHAAMEEMRRHARGFARGGRVEFDQDLPSARAMVAAGARSVDRIGAMVQRNVRATAQVLQALTGGSGAGFGSGSWVRALTELNREHVPFGVISTFRAGARTRASGSVSFHALNRAVDLVGPNMLRIWQALTDTSPTELIYSRAPLYKSRSGWHPISRLDPITRADHFSHVHAAYDRGGWLPPGTSLATNRTGRPERVLAPGETGITINFHGPVYGDRRAITEVVRQGIREALRREGKPVTV